MSKLIDLIDNSLTDKNTSHSYINTYERVFSPKQMLQNNILEIGIGEPKQNKENGGSIKLWRDYFPNSTIYALDILDISNINNCIQNNERIKLITSVNAYDTTFIENTFIKNNIMFDILIDDGPHTLDSMIFFVKHYFPLLNNKGILVIEDIPDTSWINILVQNIPEEYRKFIKIEDLRHVKNRWDDIMLIIDKSL